eukprot:Phypoly_transcript_03201.p1 GENE.Phypoly_transcript_03201~~Phypoly_transcript_03201.p1  ORF type:complete len:782 (+),score=166.52 Phypoly_transcript_03201:136-2481(+)
MKTKETAQNDEATKVGSRTPKKKETAQSDEATKAETRTPKKMKTKETAQNDEATKVETRTPKKKETAQSDEATTAETRTPKKIKTKETVQNDEAVKVETRTPKKIKTKDTAQSDEATKVEATKTEDQPTTTQTTTSAEVLKEEGVTLIPADLYAPTEEKCGIQCYLGNHEEFSGILKQRYSDFLVSEIGTNGEVVRLTNLVAPVIPQAVSEGGTDVEAFSALVGPEKAAEFLKYMESRTVDKKTKFFFEPDEDKLRRTRLHKLVKERFKDTLTETVDGAVVVMPASQPRTRRDDNSAWPADKPKYVQFYLYKENRDTMSALVVLAQLLKTTTKAFSFAGTKDRRGITVQRATAFRVSPDRLAAINPKLFRMKVGNFEYVEKHLRLGDLLGNRFQIVIRDVTASDEVLKKAVDSLTKTGFLNYYGLQRFGTGQVGTNHVGLALLKKDWEGAARLILDPREGESPEATSARTHYKKTGNLKSAIESLPSFLNVEKMLLRGLKKSGPTSFLNAFSMIPRTMRMMYAHAYQSYVWNSMVSERIRLFGFKEPVVGDLVAVETEVLPSDTAQTTEDLDLEELTETELEVQQELEPEKIKVAIVTKEDVKNKKYTIEQVVLPLPGHDVIYPKHSVTEFMRDILIKDGLDPDNLQRAQKEYDLKGAYRKIIVKPAEFSWKLMRYDDVTIPLLQTDEDLMSNKPAPVDVPTGKYKALILSFNLPSSSYATMLFRELLKIPTSKLTQKTLTEEFNFRDNQKEEKNKRKGNDGNFNRNAYEKGKRKRDNENK